MINYLEKAELLRAKSDFKGALKYYLLAAGKEKSFEVLLGLGDMLRMTGKFDKAGKAYLSAMRVSKGEQLNFADAAIGYGMAMRGSMKYKEAEKYLRLSGEIYSKEADEEGQAFALWTLGGLYRIKGELKKAITSLDKALKLYKKLKDEKNIAYALCARGGTLRLLGRFKESLQCYKVANRYFVKYKDTFGQAYSNCGMGSANRMLGNYPESDVLYRKAEKLYSSFLDEINIAYVLWGHANTLMCLGKLDEAEKLNRKAGGLFRKWKDERGLVYILLQEGELDRSAGREKNALKLFKKAVEISKKHGLKVEEVHGRMGAYMVTKQGANPIKKYDKFSTKWQSVLKKNSILNFP